MNLKTLKLNINKTKMKRKTLMRNIIKGLALTIVLKLIFIFCLLYQGQMKIVRNFISKEVNVVLKIQKP